MIDSDDDNGMGERGSMSERVIEMHSSRITIDAVGSPGQRLFLLQASDGSRVVTLKIEKQQAEILAEGIDQFLEELSQEFPSMLLSPSETHEPDVSLHEPVEVLFTIGQMGLGYDEAEESLVLVARELVPEDEADEATVARFWISPDQMRALGQHVRQVAAQGRPICPICQNPIDPAGHFCPKSNGRELKQTVG